MKRLFTFCSAIFLVLNVFAQAPKISGFSPTSGNVGSIVTINGTNFSPIAANNIVYFGSVRAEVNTASATALSVTVPNGATYQAITITSNGLTSFSADPFNVTHPTELVFAKSSFIFQESLPSGQGPIRMLTCDLNNDGKPDLANINDTSNTVSVFKNTSTTNNISFASKIDFATGNRPRGIATGDIDGDGSPDIVVGNANSNTISVFRNTSLAQGEITFAGKIDFNSNTDPREVIITDLDNDGKPDIVAITYTGGTVSILRNTSNGTHISFAPRVDLVVDWAGTRLVAADFNMDGNVDIAVPNGYLRPIAFFKNISTPGVISFDILKTGPPISGYSFVPSHILSGDLDGDGKVDIVTTDNETIFFKNVSTVGGEIDFQVTQKLGASISSPGMALANINSDGKPDLVRGIQGGGLVINWNKSSVGNMDFEFYSLPYNIANLLHASFAIADFDADGRVDIVTANWYSRNISVFKNTASDVGLNSFGYPSTIQSASTGDIVNLYGINLTRVKSVRFGGTPVDSFRIMDSSRILTYVGAGSTGDIIINSETGSATLPGFTFVPPPTITSFSPTIAGKGDTVIIKGTKFLTASTVSFGNFGATWKIIKNDSIIWAKVGSGASGNIVVKATQGLATKSGFVYVKSPVINSFAPIDALPGNIITIKGHSFSRVTKLVIANENISSFTIVSDSTITATINSYGGGKVAVTSQYGTSEKDGFYNGPVISSVDFYAASANTIITIQGKRFGISATENVVRIGDALATVVSANSNTITAKVPVGSSFGPVTVAAHNLTAYSSKSFLQTFNAPNSSLSTNSFLPKKQISSPINSMGGLDAADLDGDGKIDFVVCASSLDKIMVYKNNGSSQPFSFTTEELLTNQDIFHSQKVSLTDLNGDGKPEIMGISSGDVAVFENKSSGGNISFLPVIKIPFPVSPHSTQVADINGDGKPEIITADYNEFRIAENKSSPDSIFFKESPFFINQISRDSYIKGFSMGDYNGDGKVDISISLNDGLTYVFKNKSSVSNILYDYEPYYFWNNIALTRQITVDVDGDGREDIVGTTASDQIVIYRNISTVSNFAFSPAIIFKGISNSTDLAIADFDGNGKPDIAQVSYYSPSFSIILNQSTNGAVSFNDPIVVNIPLGSFSMTFGDFDADQKPDIALIESYAYYVSIFKNRLGEVLPLEICPPAGNSKIYTSIVGANFQWQVDTGTGFSNITNDIHYIGTSTDTLRLNNIPSSWNGRKFRCLTDNNPGEVFVLSFTNTWLGNTDNLWENSANWFCGVIPDENTDVIINSGNITISQNTTIKSLTVTPNVNIHIKPGVHLTILK